MKIKGKNILITGGGSGIGRLMGKEALLKGAKTFIIWDINNIGIRNTIKDYKRYGKVKGYKVDVSDPNAVQSAYLQTVEECGDIDILINNAGIILSNKTFDKQTVDEIVKTFNVNTLAPMFVARVILPDMLSRKSGHICNITSASGLLGNPKMSVYGASKWGATGWSESLRIELKNTGVDVTTVTPYYINTGMFKGVNSRVIPILEPSWVAKKTIRAIERNKKFAGLPFSYHFIRLCQGVLPVSLFDLIAGKWLGIYKTMDNFTGHN